MSTRHETEFQSCPPRADAIIHSLRAFGYDLGMAIADLIDNSIFAKATIIEIGYSWNNGNPQITILDNGVGMSEKVLVEAMRLGTTSPLEHRDSDDLGRFGLGLKTASFSQCKHVCVVTSQNSAKSCRYWDLDHVREVGEWELGTTLSEEDSILAHGLTELESGTVVIWKELDRIVDHNEGIGHNPESAFYEQFLKVKQYLEMVFHRFLAGSNKSLEIRVGRERCIPWDPFLISNTFTQKLHSENLNEHVSVQPYVLPHVSKRTAEENEMGSGIRGWNAHQGFYVYRNKRMIISGDYLGLDFKPEEHFKLARIRIDVTNEVDHEWSLDVRKATATPPDNLHSELRRITRATRQKATEVYRARTGNRRRNQSAKNYDDVWLKQKSGEKIIYKINKNHPVIEAIIDEIKPPASWVKKFFKTIETTVPHRLIIMDGSEHEDCHVDLPLDLTRPSRDMLQICKKIYEIQIGKALDHEEAAEIVCSIEPFNMHPLYRAMLDGLEEDYTE